MCVRVCMCVRICDIQCGRKCWSLCHTPRSVYDKASQKYGREYIDAQYNPDRFGTDMYENKAAMIAKRWDSKEDIDSGFLGDRSTTAGNGASAKHKSPDKE